MKKNIITSTAEEILDDITENKEWTGPDGKCWCEVMQKFITPNKEKCNNCKLCPQCQPLFKTDERTYRYLHLHDDYRSFGS
jgi:hypothetical protein